MSDTVQSIVTSAEVKRYMALFDAALSLAGHEVSNPELRRRAIRGDMSAAESIAASVALIDAR